MPNAVAGRPVRPPQRSSRRSIVVKTRWLRERSLAGLAAGMLLGAALLAPGPVGAQTGPACDLEWKPSAPPSRAPESVPMPAAAAVALGHPTLAVSFEQPVPRP